MKTPSILHADSGLTLIEVLVVVAALAIAGSMAVVVTANVQESVRGEKLEQDVATINRAIGIYEGNGGTMIGVDPHPWYVLGRLKAQVAADKVDETAGLTGRMIDPRLQPVFMDAEEIDGDTPRAVWDPTKRRFVVVNDNSIVGPKVKRFKLTDDTPEEELMTQAFLSGIDARELNSFGYARDGKWVWEYEEAATAPAPAPTPVTLYPGLPTTPPADPPGPAQLDPPTFSISEGSYSLGTYPILVTLVDPNSPGDSEIYYWTNGTSWLLYDGTPIATMPGTTIHALAKSLDENAWDSSPVVKSTYDAIPETLEVEVIGPISVTWAEAGGAIQPGGPAPTLVGPAQIGIANAAAIPDVFESSSNFMVYWTIDGSDPSSSGTRNEVSAFSGGFPGQSQDILLADWGTDPNLVIQAVALSEDTSLFSSSGVTSYSIGIEKTDLRDPMLSDSAAIVTITLETVYGDMPEGARVFYTLDGSDPGDLGGLPVTGTEYAGPFTVKGQGITSVPVSARVYGPEDYEHWFEPSELVESTVAVPPAVMSFRHTATIPNP